MTWRILPLLLVLPALASCEGESEPVRTPEEELKLLAGEWKLVSTEQAGKAIPNSEQILVIDGGKCTNTTVTGKANVVLKSTIAIDPAKLPKKIDVTQEDDKVVAGIYEFTGDRLRILYYDKTKPPPAGFDTKGTEHLLTIYERAMPK